MASGDASPGRDGPRRRIAFLTAGSGAYDSRTLRMARSAHKAGFDVSVYARWYPGLPAVEESDVYRLVRAPFDWRLAVPLLGRLARRQWAAQMAVEVAPGRAGRPRRSPGRPPSVPRRASMRTAKARSAIRRARRPFRAFRRRWWRMLLHFPLTGLGWAQGLDPVVEPADIWHGMWAGSLPALAHMRARHGGRTIYDSRDVYLLSRDFASAGRPGRSILAWLERRWARGADRVLTVNDAYADLLAAQLGVTRPTVVMNMPERWTPPAPPPDLLRTATGIPAEVAVILYEGGLMTGRGIEQCMEAMLEVPGAALCLLGFGGLRNKLTQQAAAAPYAGRVFVIDAVPPDDLLAWTASADVSLMAIQPTTLNHEFTTPQKLFESIAAGVPVVAADLPGMTAIVAGTEIGVVCDPTSPAAIAEAIHALLAEGREARARRRDAILRLAHDRYNWESQEGTLLALYRELAPPVARSGSPARAAAER